MHWYYAGITGERILKRRDFLRSGVAAALLTEGRAFGQAALPKAAKKLEGIPVNDAQSLLSGARVFKIVEPTSLDAVRAAFKLAQTEEKSVCIAGGRHSMGGQPFAEDGVLLDIRKMNRVLAFDVERGLLEVEAGMQWPQLLEYLANNTGAAPKPWTFSQKQADVDRVTLGGSLSANMHGNGLALAPFIGDIESFRLLNGRGDLLQCSRSENPELFRLAIGGYGLFGFVYSVTLRLVPRRKVQRIAEVRAADGVMRALAERIADGFAYGEFQFATDERSADFLRRGVLCCYRPVADDMPIEPPRRALTERDGVELLVLAHADKAEAFRRRAAYYQATSEQVLWADEMQMSLYPENYHREIDRKLQLENRATEGLTEVFVERDGLEGFLADVRTYTRASSVNIIYSTLRLIEPDRESFLPWARRPYACVTFSVHIEHNSAGLIRAGDQFRRLIDIALRHGGSYYLPYHRHALRRQVDACFPQFREFLLLKRKYDKEELFQSDWYRHYKRMYNL
jgi:FAD/FMN-containing dehydrogenase